MSIHKHIIFRYITAGEPAKPAPDLNGNNANDNVSTANANGNITVKKLAQNLSNVSKLENKIYTHVLI